MDWPRSAAAAAAEAPGALADRPTTPPAPESLLGPIDTDLSTLGALLSTSTTDSALKIDHSAALDRLACPTPLPTDMTGMFALPHLLAQPMRERPPALPLPDSGIESLDAALGYDLASQATSLLCAGPDRGEPTMGPFAQHPAPFDVYDGGDRLSRPNLTSIRLGPSIPRSYSLASTESSFTSIAEQVEPGGAVLEARITHHADSTYDDSGAATPRPRTPTPPTPTPPMPTPPTPIADMRRLSCSTRTTPPSPSETKTGSGGGTPSRNGRVNTTPKEIYHCEQCARTFDKKAHYERHLASHTGAKPFRCEHCDKAFPRMDSLKRHERLHDSKDGPGALRRSAQQKIQHRVRHMSSLEVQAVPQPMTPLLSMREMRRSLTAQEGERIEMAITSHVYGMKRRVPDSLPEGVVAQLDAGSPGPDRKSSLMHLLVGEDAPEPTSRRRRPFAAPISARLADQTYKRRLSTPNLIFPSDRPMPSQAFLARRGSHAGIAFGGERRRDSGVQVLGSPSAVPGSFSSPPRATPSRVTGPAHLSYDRMAVASFEPFSAEGIAAGIAGTMATDITPGFRFPAVPLASAMTSRTDVDDAMQESPHAPADTILPLLSGATLLSGPLISLPSETSDCPTTPRDDLAKALPEIGGVPWTKPTEMPDKPEHVSLCGRNMIQARYSTGKPMQAIERAQTLADDRDSIDLEDLQPGNLDWCIRAYFVSFHPTLPVIHSASFIITEANDLLLVSIICVGSVYSKDPRIKEMGSFLWWMLQKAVKAHWRILHKEAGHFDSGPGIALCQTILLSQIYASMAADPKIRSVPYPDQGIGYRMAVLSGLLRQDRPDPTQYISQAKDEEGADIAWRSWAAKESQLRSILGHYILDGKMSESVDVPSTLKHLHNRLHAVCEDALFLAPTAQAWIQEVEKGTPDKRSAASTYADLYRQLFQPGSRIDIGASLTLPGLSRMTLLVGLQATIADLGPQLEAAPVAQPNAQAIALALARLNPMFDQQGTSTKSILHVQQMSWHAISICLQMRMLNLHIDGVPLASATSPEGCWTRKPLARRMLLHANAIRILVQELPQTDYLGYPQFYVPQCLHAAASVFIAFTRGHHVLPVGRHILLDAKVDWQILGLAGYDTRRSRISEDRIGDFIEHGGQPALSVRDGAAGEIRQVPLSLSHVAAFVTQLKRYGQVWGIAEVWAREIQADCRAT